MRWNSSWPSAQDHEGGEGQIAEFVEDDEVAPGELVGGAALASGAVLGVEMVGQVDDIVAAAAGALADTGPGDGDGEIGLAGPGAADQYDVVLERNGSRRTCTLLLREKKRPCLMPDRSTPWQPGKDRLGRKK